MFVGKLFRKFYEKYRDFRFVADAKKDAKKIAEMPTYFPELERKSYEERVRDNKRWARRFKESNRFYTLYGFDIKGFRKQNEYIDYFSFMLSRDTVNRIGEKWSYVSLLRDKYLFYKFLSSNSVPVPEVFGVIRNGELFDSSLNSVSFDSIIHETDYFLKDIDGECASFVKHINDYNQLEEYKNHISNGGYILQRKVKQNAVMAGLNPYAINTLRVITINKNGDPYVISALLRVGTKKTGSVDNWAAGGLAIGIEKDGRLKEYGFYKPAHGIKTDVHPDSGVKFNEFIIPMFKEALELAKKAHRCFYGIRAIGWDIAISEDGPVFIEGNDNFEISLQQACDRPLKKDWLKACN